LQPQAALAFGMGVHELTTNAVKYGALSVADGRVEVSWRIEHSQDAERLYFEWVEKNGPGVVAPTRLGFGMTLIERGLRQDMGADVQIAYAPSGVRATIVAPMTIMAGGPSANASSS